MSREIKFRAWDDLNKCWIHDFRIHPQGMVFPATALLDEGSEQFWLYERSQGAPLPVTLQQFTGVKDKHGKEIYEGDIVRWSIDDRTYEANVYYDTAHACYWMGENRLDKSGLVVNDWGRGSYEVIGHKFAAVLDHIEETKNARE